MKKRTAALILWAILCNYSSIAQNLSESCNLAVQCYDTGDPADYTVISSPSGLPVLLSQLITNHTVLPHIDPFANIDAQHIPQRLEISSPVIINVPYTFAPGSELVFTTIAARLEIESDLSVFSSHIHGCEVLWKGLVVKGNGKLLAYDNCIEDAESAIRLRDGSAFEIKGNVFSRNAFSIFGGRENIFDVQEAYITPIGVGISGNDFNGADDLIVPFGGFVKPLNAIRLHSVAQITIGGGEDNNIIHDFAHSNPNTLSPLQSLFSFNTNLTVQKTKFHNIGYALNTGGYAIYSYCEGTNKQLNVYGLGKNNVDPTFLNCEIGIFSQSNILTVQDCFFNFGSQHIIVWITPFPHQFNISENRFKAFETSAFACVASRYNQCRIFNNLFDDDVNASDYHDDPGLPSGTQRCQKYAIISSGLAGQGPPIVGVDLLEIFGNTFTDLQKPPFADNLSGGYSLALYSVNYIAEVHDNVFSQQHTGPFKHFYKGVYLETSNNNKVSDNTFSGVANYSDPINEIFESLSGIHAFESRNNAIRCNYFYNIKEGVRFHGGCDGTVLQKNSFANHNKGVFLLTAATRIGVQDKRSNIWPGVSGLPDFEAFHGENPSIFQVALSRFFIQYFESPTSAYWANPRSHQGWFVPAGGATPDPEVVSPYLCSEEPEVQITKSEEMYLEGAFPVHKGYAEMNWEVALNLYERLFYRPELRPTGSAEAVFFDNESSSNLGYLHNAMRQFAQVNAVPFGIAHDWDYNQNQVADVLSQLKANGDAMATASTESEKIQLVNERLSLNDQLQTLNAIKQDLVTTFLTGRQSRINQLNVFLSSIVPNAAYESNLKVVLTVLSEALSANEQTNFTQQQKNSLEAVANQCRYSGGLGVVLARSALKKSPFDYNDEALCPGGDEVSGGSGERSQIYQTIDITISPNPVHDFVQVAFSGTFNDGTLFFQDLTGRSILVEHLGQNNQARMLDLSRLPIGTYLVRAVLDGQKTSVKMLFKTN